MPSIQRKSLVWRSRQKGAPPAWRRHAEHLRRLREVEARASGSRRPEISEAELDWRVNCIIGAQVFSQMYSERVEKFFGEDVDVDESRAVQWMLHFILHGVNAPPFAGRGGATRR